MPSAHLYNVDVIINRGFMLFSRATHFLALRFILFEETTSLSCPGP